MRDISGTLLEAEQQKASYTPYVRVYLPDLSYYLCDLYLVAETATFAHPGRCLARKSDGTLCLAYTKTNSYEEVHVIYSSDNGENWSGDEQISTDEEKDHYFAVAAIDSSDKLYVSWLKDRNAFAGDDYVYMYYRIKNESWGDITEGTTGNPIKEPAMAIDSLDVAHWIYASYGGLPSYWQVRHAVIGESPELVNQADSGLREQGCCSVGITSDGVIHASWEGRGWDPYFSTQMISYARKESGAWQAREAVSTEAHSCPISQLIAVDDDDVRIIWLDLYDSAVYYRKRTTSWGDAETLSTGNLWSPTLSRDIGEAIHGLWPVLDTDYNAYSKRITGWSEPQNPFDPTVSTFTPNNTLYSLYPIVAGKRTNVPQTGFCGVINIYNAVTGVEYIWFYKTKTLAWE